MQFTTTFSILSAVVAAFLASTAEAADYRQLVTFKGGDSTAFCKSWKCDCINYTPTDSTLYFQGAYCEPGDFQGKNTTTQAKVFCTFTNGSTVKTINKHIASETGATLQ